MENNTKSNVFRKLNYLSLIPYFGFLISLFYGAYKIDKSKKGKQYVFAFMLLSLLCLMFFSGIAIVIFYFFILGKGYVLQIVLLLILCYISFLCGSIASNAIHKGIMEKFKKQEEINIKENLY